MPKKALLLVSLLLLLAASLPSLANASTTVTITPSSADSYGRIDQPTQAYGSDTFILVQGPNVDANAFMRFSIPPELVGLSVESASLKLYDTAGNGGTKDFSLYQVNEDWAEDTLTWDNQPATESLPTDIQTFETSDTGYHTWDVTSDVQAILSGADSNYGWCLHMNGGWTTFASKEGSEEQRPQLDISYTQATVESCDAVGNLKDTFSAGEPVSVVGSGYVPNRAYDVYVVSDVASWTDGMKIPDRIPFTVVSLTALDTGELGAPIIYHNPLPGKYDIIIDVNGNGQYDAGIDALDSNDVEVTAGFFVVPEYLLGGLMALIMCFSAFFILKRPQLIQRSI